MCHHLNFGLSQKQLCIEIISSLIICPLYRNIDNTIWMFGKPYFINVDPSKCSKHLLYGRVQVELFKNIEQL